MTDRNPLSVRAIKMARWLAMVFPILSVTASAEDLPEEIGSQRILFVDDHRIASRSNVSLRLHAPESPEVVFKFDAPWEGPQSGYVTVLRDGDRFRLYYRGGGDLGREVTCVAESDDGRRWTRPALGLFAFRGSKENNIVWTGERKAYDESHNFSPFIDQNPAARPSQRYKAVTLDKVGSGDDRHNALAAFESPDGIHWKKMREEPILDEGAFDSHNTAFWDTVAGHYVCYLRVGREGKRSISRSTSRDFLHWTRPEPLDFGDTPLEHFYTNGIVPYVHEPRLYLGFPMRFVPPSDRGFVGLEKRKTDGLSDAVFMSSHDGLRWDRTFMEAFLRPGLDPQNWGGAHGNSTPAWGLLATSPSELSIYWSEHYGNYPEGDSVPQLRRGTLRTDGFVSIHAPYSGGEWSSKPLVFHGNTLTINVSTSAVGSVQVEIQDAEGHPIPGYTLDDCPEIWGDEIARVVSWRKGQSLAPLAGRRVRLRFVMRDADLFALRFVEQSPAAPAR